MRNGIYPAFLVGTAFSAVLLLAPPKAKKLPEYETPDVTQYEKIADELTDSGLFMMRDVESGNICYVYVQGVTLPAALHCKERDNAENVSHRMAPDNVVVRDDR